MSRPSQRPRRHALAALAALVLLAGCGLAGGDGLNRPAGGVYAPGAAGPDPDPLLTGHRLMAANLPDLALDAYLRATARDGLTVDTLSALGSANLRLGRLGQAEGLLRQAVAEDPGFAPAWNNLGVLLAERRDWGEASEAFRRAYAADSGQSDTIRDNLRLALGRLEGLGYTGVNAADGSQPAARLVGPGTDTSLDPEPL